MGFLDPLPGRLALDSCYSVVVVSGINSAQLHHLDFFFFNAFLDAILKSKNTSFDILLIRTKRPILGPMLIMFNKINEFIFKYHNNNAITVIAVNTSFYSLVDQPLPLLALAFFSLPFAWMSNIAIFGLFLHKSIYNVFKNPFRSAQTCEVQSWMYWSIANLFQRTIRHLPSCRGITFTFHTFPVLRRAQQNTANREHIA